MSFIAQVKGRLGADPNTLNWVLLALSLLLTLSMAALLGVLSGSSKESMNRQPSTFFTDDSGLRAAYLAVGQFTPTVRWRRVLMALPPPSEDSPAQSDAIEPPEDEDARGWASVDTLIVAGPSNPLSPGEAEALREWVEAGGQIILCLDKDWPISRSQPPLTGSQPDGMREGSPEPRGTESQNGVQDEVPSQTGGPAPVGGFLAGLGIRIAADRPPAPAPGEPADEDSESPRPGQPTEGRPQQQTSTLMLDDGGASRDLALTGEGLEDISAYPSGRRAAWKQVGRGRVAVIADPWAFSNLRLSESSNAVWLVQAASSWGGGRTAFDEAHHGFIRQRGLSSLLISFARTPWGWACLQMLAALLAYLFLFRSLFGRRQDPPAPRRSSPLQWIDARAGLLQAAGAGRLCAQWMHRSLALRLSRSLGYSVDLDQPRLREKIGSGGHARARSFREYLRQWRGLPAQGPVSARQLDQLARAAGHLTQELKARQ